MDRYEKAIHLLDVYVKRWKEIFDHYCEMTNDESISDAKRAMYANKANEAYMYYNELGAVLNDILGVTNSEKEES